MSDLPWSKFFWSDWESDPGLKLCSLAAQGLWMRMLCVCAKSAPKGYLSVNGNPVSEAGLARLCGVSEGEAKSLVQELSDNGVFSRDRRGWIYSRRMLSETKKAEVGRKHANKRWSQDTERETEKIEPNGSSDGSGDGVPTTQKLEARVQSSSEDKSSDAKASLDPAKIMFDSGVRFLGQNGIAEKQARSLIGGWRKAHGEPAVIEAIGRAAREGPSEPVEFIVGCLRSAKKPKPGEPVPHDWENSDKIAALHRQRDRSAKLRNLQGEMDFGYEPSAEELDEFPELKTYKPEVARA